MNVYECTALTGGGANALDAISWSNLSDGDMAFVTVSQRFYVFRYSASSSGAEAVTAHPYTVKPDDAGANNGRWLEATSVIVESDFDHDSLSGFVANEHIDWTNAADNFAATGSVTITDAVDLFPFVVTMSAAANQFVKLESTTNYSKGISLLRNESGGSYNVTWSAYIPNNFTELRITSDQIGNVLRLYADTGNAKLTGTMDADDYIDHTPMFAGDAIEAIRGIAVKGAVKNSWGELDHDTLPTGVLAEFVEKDAQEKDVVVKRRNLSSMVSLLTKGMQELVGRIEALEAK